MIGWLGTPTIYLATAPTDLRKVFDGLAALVRQYLGQDPLSGSLWVFCNRRRDRIKILVWEAADRVISMPACHDSGWRE